jgi:hypothetical protein
MASLPVKNSIEKEPTWATQEIMPWNSILLTKKEICVMTRGRRLWGAKFYNSSQNFLCTLWDHLAACLCLPLIFCLFSVWSMPFQAGLWDHLAACVSTLVFSFSVWSISYQRKVGDYFFPEINPKMSSFKLVTLPYGVGSRYQTTSEDSRLHAGVNCRVRELTIAL